MNKKAQENKTSKSNTKKSQPKKGISNIPNSPKQIETINKDKQNSSKEIKVEDFSEKLEKKKQQKVVAGIKFKFNDNSQQKYSLRTTQPSTDSWDELKQYLTTKESEHSEQNENKNNAQTLNDQQNQSKNNSEFLNISNTNNSNNNSAQQNSETSNNTDSPPNNESSLFLPQGLSEVRAPIYLFGNFVPKRKIVKNQEIENNVAKPSLSVSSVVFFDHEYEFSKVDVETNTEIYIPEPDMQNSPYDQPHIGYPQYPYPPYHYYYPYSHPFPQQYYPPM